MSKKNNKQVILLSSILGVLVIVWLGFSYVKDQKRESRKFNPNIVQVEKEQITQLKVYPKTEDQAEIIFTKEGESWMARKGDLKCKTREEAIDNMVDELVKIKAKSLKSKGDSSWVKYEVTDSLGTRVIAFDANGKELANIVIGKFDIKQLQNQMGGQQQFNKNNFRSTTFVRKEGDDRCYAVEGFLPFTFNQSFNSWRDDTFLKATADSITKIKVDFVEDELDLELTKTNGKWVANNTESDSAKAVEYLNMISNKTNASFINDYNESGTPLITLSVEAKGESYKVKCFHRTTDFALHSSLNPDVYFQADSAYVKDLFRIEQRFLPVLTEE